MRISKLKVSGFKSLVDFEIDLAKFTCLIGLNGSGKSTILQCLDFLSQLAQGNMDAWFKERQWLGSDVRTKLKNKYTIEFSVSFNNGNLWKGVYNISKRRCTSEELATTKTTLSLNDQYLRVNDETKDNIDKLSGPINFEYSGSVFSRLRKDFIPSPMSAIINYMASLGSFDLLSPETIRRRTKDLRSSIGLGGQYLSSYIGSLTPESHIELKEKLRSAYPHLESFAIHSLRGGVKSLFFSETYTKQKHLITDARHINDGLLRLLAIFAELQGSHPFVLFDEIENGINPELVEFLLDALVGGNKQIMVTTHSPLILNYLEDDIAREGVVFIFKTPDGRAQAKPFFSIPSTAEKLAVMGPGEVFADTDLVALTRELNGE